MDSTWVSERAEAQISALYSIMPALYQCLAPRIAVVLGKCACPAPELEEMGTVLLCCLALQT